MLTSASTSFFEWPTGDAGSWRLSVDRRGRRPPLIVYDGNWSDVCESRNRPLQDTPDLFLELGALGMSAWNAGERRLKADAANLINIKSPNPLFYAEYDASVQREVLAFVRKHGPLHEPVRYLEPQPEWILEEFLTDAHMLWLTLLQAKDIDDIRRRSSLKERQEDNEFWRKLVRLQMTFNTNFAPVYLGWVMDEAALDLRPAYYPRDLLGAAWLMFYQALAGNQMWRYCEGCGDLFVTGDPRRKYHDGRCRNRTLVRRSRRKASERKEG